jgi:SAM-dependent methyltransferase
MAGSSEFRRFWDSEAPNWIAWAREPGHDAYWDYAPAFFDEIVPETVGRTLEVGCGEGRVTRDLRARGYDVYSIDGAPSLVLAAALADRDHRRYAVADAAKLPFPDETFDCVVAYNVLMGMDDMQAAVRDVGRVIRPEGRFCFCVTHPMIDVGAFESREADARFVIDQNYLGTSAFDQTLERAGLRMRFRGRTSPLGAYAVALESAGFLIERLREPAQRAEAVERNRAEQRWQRLPNFLFVRAVKLS